MLHPTFPVTGNKHTLGIAWTGSKRNRSLLIRNALMHPSPRYSTYGSAILAHLFRRRGTASKTVSGKKKGEESTPWVEDLRFFVGGDITDFAVREVTDFMAREPAIQVTNLAYSRG